ncbi:MAG: DNA topoisomerase IV [Flavobacterium sp. BFFFF1]|uniref:DNA topoisomerase IV n=1 Tax=Flavobacterium sp. BFFFF1 TaxID=2015557 RepID=UPI000BCC3D17|nr:DNA topoisomerase IV [Flavobacterium sp. BFFFF1]OYU80010.1 MAG: DNA topoisomerase IV [Flavobacterium sp. BFFFF1]
MKKVSLLLAALILTACFESPEKKCTDFKIGKFRVEQTINGKRSVTVFERNDSIEVETYNGKKDTSSIRWVGDCEYILRKKHPKNRQEAIAIDMKILTTSKNSYTFEFGEVGKSKTFTATAVKITD